jgi:hypothetical protein
MPRSKEQLKAYQREYAEKNREKIRKYSREWLAKKRAENPEKYKKRSKEYREANAEKIREYERLRSIKRRDSDPEGHRTYMRKYKEENREKLNEQSRLWAAEQRATNPEFKSRELANSRKFEKRNFMKRRETKLLEKYGITNDDYDRMLELQDGKCAICGTTEPGAKKKYFCVDHCHTTKKVRQLLCTTCNVGLSRFYDNPDFLREAALYLERHKTISDSEQITHKPSLVG